MSENKVNCWDCLWLRHGHAKGYFICDSKGVTRINRVFYEDIDPKDDMCDFSPRADKEFLLEEKTYGKRHKVIHTKCV